MNNIEENLLPNEKVMLAVKPHWILFIDGFLIAIFAMVIYRLTIKLSPTASTIAFFAIFLSGIAIGFLDAIAYFTTEFGLTDKRIIARSGWIRRYSIEMFLLQVESISIKQTFLGRVLNFGTITFVGTGGTKEFFRAIPNPLELRKRVHQQIQDLDSRSQKE